MGPLESASMTITLQPDPEIESQMRLVEPPPVTLEEFEAALEAFADDSEDMPVLPPEALTREAIYEGELDVRF